MASVNTPITATQTETQCDDAIQNPTLSSPSATHGNVAHISIIFGPGITHDPAAIFDMVDAQYGTVASNRATVARGTYIFKVEA